MASAIRLTLPVMIPATSFIRISVEFDRIEKKAALDFLVNTIVVPYSSPLK
jgi:hypothetical protein